MYMALPLVAMARVLTKQPLMLRVVIVALRGVSSVFPKAQGKEDFTVRVRLFSDILDSGSLRFLTKVRCNP
jgi:hypothetical protein